MIDLRADDIAEPEEPVDIRITNGFRKQQDDTRAPGKGSSSIEIGGLHERDSVAITEEFDKEVKLARTRKHER